jgi:hypothetical protein
MATLEAVVIWSRANWDKILTVLLGIIMAALAIRAALATRRKIVVNLRCTEAEAGTIHITATNSGPRPVMLQTVGLIIPGSRPLPIDPSGPSIKVLQFDKEGNPMRPPRSSIDLPGYVPSEEPVDVWMGVEWAQDFLVRKGVRGKVRIRGFYNDARGHVYKSKKVDFDAGSKRRSRPIPPRPAP